MQTDVGWLKEWIRDVPDFPQPGVIYKDITPLLADAGAFRCCVDTLAGYFSEHPVDKVLGIEARGFIIAAPVAYRMGAGFVPVRKIGKLPWQVESEEYTLEYGSGLLEIHRDALAPGERALIIDDVLATGGTASAAMRLVAKLGATAVGVGCVIELGFLGGRAKLGGIETISLLNYE